MKAPPTKIRRAKAADAETVARLAADLGYPSPVPDVRNRLRRLAKRPDHAVLVAEMDSQPVGWLHASRKLSLEAGEFAEIGGMVVDGSCRGQGVGAALVRAAEAWACRQGVKILRVRSNVIRHRAHAFYERLGFSLVKSQKVFQKPLR